MSDLVNRANKYLQANAAESGADVIIEELVNALLDAQALNMKAEEAVAEDLAEILKLREQLEKKNAALRDISSWKNDTLGKRPREPGHWATEGELNAFDRGTRMAFYRCADRADAALSDEHGEDSK